MSEKSLDGKICDMRQPKVFISHSGLDKDYVEALVELLEDIGLPDGTIVCTSVPGHGVPGGAKIYNWLREQFLICDLRVIFCLSENYYSSPACLNEMGAAWVTKANESVILLPSFEFKSIRGCIDPTEIGIKLDGDEAELKHRLNELKDALISEHCLPQITIARWERIRNSFIMRVTKTKDGKCESNSKETKDNDYALSSSSPPTTDLKMPSHIPVESAFLLVYAAYSDGRIIRYANKGSSNWIISVTGKVFMRDHSHEESKRWHNALGNLVDWKWVGRNSKNGNIFELTSLGYRIADVLQKEMDINISENPLDEISKF